MKITTKKAVSDSAKSVQSVYIYVVCMYMYLDITKSPSVTRKIFASHVGHNPIATNGNFTICFNLQKFAH